MKHLENCIVFLSHNPKSDRYHLAFFGKANNKKEIIVLSHEQVNEIIRQYNETLNLENDAKKEIAYYGHLAYRAKVVIFCR